MSRDILSCDLDEIYDCGCEWDKFSGKTILLTGAYGMLASYVTYFFIFLHEIKRIDVNLILLVRSEKKLKKCIGNIRRDYIKVCYDSMNERIKIDGNIDFIIHAASLASPQHYATRPVDVLMPNTIGTYHLLRLAAEKKVSGFLLFSTGDIYGRVMSKGAVTECDYGVMDTLDIHNCYSESKRMAETMCYSFMSQFGVPVKIARIWHTYAPTMDEKNDPRVFASFVKNVVAGEDIVIKSDGTGKRTFCYITDAVCGFLKILLDGKNGEAYNVCNESQFVSILELAEIIAGLRPQRELRVIYKKRNEDENYVENTHMTGIEICPSSDKLKLLGWKPVIDLEMGFDRVLRYKGI